MLKLLADWSSFLGFCSLFSSLINRALGVDYRNDIKLWTYRWRASLGMRFLLVFAEFKSLNGFVWQT